MLFTLSFWEIKIPVNSANFCLLYISPHLVADKINLHSDGRSFSIQNNRLGVYFLFSSQFLFTCLLFVVSKIYTNHECSWGFIYFNIGKRYIIL